VAATDLSDDLLRAAARLSRWASQSATFDIPHAQARLLALIDENGTMRIRAIAEADHTSQPTVTTQVQRMEAAGWVCRRADAADARASLVSLTPAGRAALARIRAARAAVLDPVIAALQGPGRSRVRDAVAVMTELLDAASAGPPGPRPTA